MRPHKLFPMINRDGTCVSLWQDTVTDFKASRLPDTEKVYDVIIVGGGITGITSALLLQEEGKDCLLLEAANLGFGTTGGTTAHLNTLLDTPYTTIAKNFGKENAQLVSQSVKEAIELIQRNINNYNIDCGFEHAKAYLFARDEKQEKELGEIAEASNDAGIELRYSEEIPVPIGFNKAIEIDGQAKFIPTTYIYGVARAFEKAGGTIQQDCRVMGVEQNDMITVESTSGTFRCGSLIYATHIPPGVNLLHFRCIPYRSYAMAVTLRGGKYPENLSYDMYDPYHYYRTQEIKGKKYLIVGGYDHKTAHEENTEACFLKLESHIREHFNVKEVEYKWSSQYFEPADGLPYIGHLPGHPGNIFVATGYSGNGMVYSAVAARLLTSLINGQESPYESLYNPNRIKPIAGFVNFMKHNTDVVKLFIGKWFSHDELEELVELAPGEGKVVVYNGQKIALHKNDDGALFALNPLCTHIKCEVKWNSAERSWDCPCHGTRYSYQGKVITGPADTDLEIIEIKSLVEK